MERYWMSSFCTNGTACSLGSHEMIPRTHSLSFDGRLLERGFWLYVWEIKKGARALHYVGLSGVT